MLNMVGLSYIKIGQSATTLSGGEAQRVKLSKELSRRATGKTVYILDEPTTGLHFDDIRKLLEVLQALVDQGNTVIVIEHNLDVIKTADWIVDLGPEGGDGGGEIVAAGKPEDIVGVEASHTARFLAPYLTEAPQKSKKNPPERPRSGETVRENGLTDTDSIVDWLINGAPGAETPLDVHLGLCDRLAAAGVGIARGAAYVETLHPTVVGRRMIWEPGKEAQVDEASFAFAESEAYRTTPIVEVYRTGKPVRRELHRQDCPEDFPAVAEFRGEGMTDYLALPLRFTNGEIQAVSWTTRRPGGFSESDLNALNRVNAPLARLVEAFSLRRVAGNLLDTYLGSRTGSQILAGHIRRGDAEIIDAAVWLSDLRGFTALADTLTGEELIDTLNSHFDALVPAVTENGGEVLKFMGDGMLAIFPTGEGQSPEAAAKAAITAALQARQNMSDLNGRRENDGRGRLSFGLALNIGRLHYGNIGAENRLDFTAIGPAVNLAARIEAVAAEKERDIVVSAAFRKYLRIPTESLGEFAVKGIAEPVPVFAVPDAPSTRGPE